MDQIQAPQAIAEYRRSIEEFIARYLQAVDVKPTTREGYRKALTQYVKWINDNGIEGNQRGDILAYKTHLIATYTAGTVNAYISAVRGFYAYLEAEKVYPNIAAGIKGAKQPQGFRKDALTIEQARNLLTGIDRDTLEGMRDYALVNLLTRTGLRDIEAERANIGDIVQQGGESLLYIQGKGRDSKDAFVILTESTLQPLRAYIKARGKEATPAAPLFVSNANRNAGGRLTTRSISRIIKTALKASGIDTPRITAHSLRHTAITFSLLAGATVQEAQSMARHSSVNTTLIYSHNIDRIASAPERKIDTLLAI